MLAIYEIVGGWGRGCVGMIQYCRCQEVSVLA